MNCQTRKEQLSLLVDNELTADQMPPLFLHLSECEECRNFFLQIKLFHDTVPSLPAAAAPEGIDRIVQTLVMGESTPPLINRTFSIRMSSALYSLGLVAVMTFLIFAMGKMQEKDLSRQFLQSVYEVERSTGYFPILQ